MKKEITLTRRISFLAGIFYILTFVSIPTLSLYGPVREPGYILGNGSDHKVVLGGILEVIVALTGIGSALALYPVLRRQNQTVSLGLIASRTLEAATIFLGVAFLLSIVTLRKNGTGSEGLASAQTLVALYDRIFVLGQGFIPAINDLLLGYLLYKSRLVPRALSLLGIAGAFVLLAVWLTIMSGYIDRLSVWSALSAIPVAVFEFSLGLYLLIRGFKPSPLLNEKPAT